MTVAYGDYLSLSFLKEHHWYWFFGWFSKQFALVSLRLRSNCKRTPRVQRWNEKSATKFVFTLEKLNRFWTETSICLYTAAKKGQQHGEANSLGKFTRDNNNYNQGITQHFFINNMYADQVSFMQEIYTLSRGKKVSKLKGHRNCACPGPTVAITQFYVTSAVEH